jgi:O-antigen biosynthesis protein
MTNSIIKTIRSLWNRIRFLASFIKELGGLHIFATKIIKVLFQDGAKGLIIKTGYIIKQSKLTSSISINTKEYHRWIALCDSLNEEKRRRIMEQQAKFTSGPPISVIMPTYNSNPKWLAEAIESVRNQIYTNWELCIADDASTDRRVIKTLDSFAQNDPRIKVTFRKENGHISAASNSALEMATGEFVALLDHDDILSEEALFQVAGAINKNPNAALLYSDEDKLDKKGHRNDPNFKCDWNYYLFLGQNYINHLGIYKTEFVKKIGGFRAGFEGAQDYDLALRFIEQIETTQIVHIPRALYHWRQHKESAAEKSGNKPYAAIAAQRALEEHLRRTGVAAEVEIQPSGYYRIFFKLPPNPPPVTIIIPTKNNQKILERCVESILSNTDYPNFELIVVDNNSDDQQTLAYFDELEKKDRVTLLKDARPFNFSAINNRAIGFAKSEFILLLNDDTEVINPDWLAEMMGIALQPGIGAVGAKLIYPNKTIQHAGVVLGIGGVGGHVHKRISINNYGYFGKAVLMQELSAVTAACLLIRKAVFDEVGGFDDVNLAVAFNDVDLCLKIREKGYRIVFTPFAQLYHHESISRGDDLHREKVERFMKENNFMIEKWSQTLFNDPAYNPNLTLEREDFSLAWPTRRKEVF